jgi:uncharacterized protein (DUF362 family)
MRIAAPLASTFVLWLLGIGSSLLFLKNARAHFKRSRYFTAAFILAIGGITSAVLISMPNSPIQAATKITTQAATPIGDAKGVHPGRVVWVHDPSVTNWSGSGDGHWWESKHTNQTVVDKMLSRTIHELTGKSSDTAAWDTLFKYYNNTHGHGSSGYKVGEKIAIKTNFTFCNYFPDFCCVDSMTYSLNKKLDYMNTSPQMIRALLRQLINVAGVKQSDISVGDPVAYYPNEFYDSCHAEFPNVQYIDHAGKFGRTKVEFSKSPIYWSCRPAGVKQDYVPSNYANATYLINLANMKSHLGGGITLCAKNHYGSLIRLPTESGYYDLHQSLAFKSPQMGSYRALVDILGSAQLGGKTMLNLIDGLYAGNHNNDTVPHKWKIAPFNGGWTSSIFASQDPLAIECVLFDLFQLDDDPFQYPKIAGADDYLIEAAQANNPPSGTFYDPNHAIATERLQSLGVTEHWNNPVDRKYSGNLGTGKGIELLFIDGTTSNKRGLSQATIRQSGYSIKQLSQPGMVEFSLPKSETVTLTLFDDQGKKMGTILDGKMSAGIHQIDLFQRASKNLRLSSRSYVIVLNSNVNGISKSVTSLAMAFLR